MLWLVTQYQLMFTASLDGAQKAKPLQGALGKGMHSVMSHRSSLRKKKPVPGLLARQCLLHEAHTSSQKWGTSPWSNKLQQNPEPQDKRNQENEQVPALGLSFSPEQKTHGLSQAVSHIHRFPSTPATRLAWAGAAACLLLALPPAPTSALPLSTLPAGDWEQHPQRGARILAMSSVRRRHQMAAAL